MISMVHGSVAVQVPLAAVTFVGVVNVIFCKVPDCWAIALPVTVKPPTLTAFAAVKSKVVVKTPSGFSTGAPDSDFVAIRALSAWQFGTQNFTSKACAENGTPNIETIETSKVWIVSQRIVVLRPVNLPWGAQPFGMGALPYIRQQDHGGEVHLKNPVVLFVRDIQVAG